MKLYDGKTVVITGGTTGIGLATAKLFINEGARVIVTGRTPATIEAAQAELGENAIVVRSDATSFPDMDALVAKVRETFGKLDVLFVNAGYGHFMSFEAVTPGPIGATDILQKVGMPKESADQIYIQMAQSVPMKRLGQPEEIARAVAFLAFEATFTTGAELPVDGGWSQL